jgi:hypothetical protein
MTQRKHVMVALVGLAACAAPPGDDGLRPEETPLGAMVQAATSAPGPLSVAVVNTAAAPVPTQAIGTTEVAGSVSIAGIPAVQAQQSGTWAMSVVGEVDLAPDSSVLAAQSGPWSVSLAGSPTVAVSGISGTTNVNVTNTPSVNLAGTPTVHIDNGVASPAVVRIADDPARLAYQRTLALSVPPGTVLGGQRDPPRHPEGQRLVIEHVSGNADVPTGQSAYVALVSRIGTEIMSDDLLNLRFERFGSFSFDPTKDRLLLSAQVRLYADHHPNKPYLILVRDGDTGSAFATVTVSGYLVSL